MVVNVRSCNKRNTDPFNEKVRARIFNSFGSTTSSSSGSEHDAETDTVSTSSSSASPCLSHLVQDFLESSSPSSTTTYDPTVTRSDSDSDSDSDSGEFLESDPTAMIHNVIHPTLYNNADPFRIQLLSHVTKAIEIFSFFRNKNKSIFNRNIMAYLREIGYNAGICKTKWNASKNGTVTAGSYEFIDVVIQSDSQVRYIIDAEFGGEFEIARETENYRILRASLPMFFVGRVDDLKKIIRLMCDEARRSMKINGLTLPPWRRNRYMQIKWLGSYRRTTNYFPTNEVASKKASNFAVKCRSVGFNISGDKVLLSPLR